MNAWPDPLDALFAAPDSHSLVFENDHVRVVTTRIAPGETTALHTHCRPQVMIVESFSDFIRRPSTLGQEKPRPRVGVQFLNGP